jgi:hypothetical protein
MLARSVIISLSCQLSPETREDRSLLSTLLESDGRYNLGLLPIDRGNSDSDGRRDDARLGRGMRNIGPNHQSVLGEELRHGDGVGDTTELGMDLHRH